MINESKKMLEQRFESRRIAEKEKRDLMSKVELMKKKGNFDLD